MISKRTGSPTAQRGMLHDASKGPGLLYGILLIFCMYGLAVALKMIWLGRPAGLLELVLFGLLAADGIILLTVARGAIDERPGLLPHLGLWMLGLIPYFGWVIVYALGRRIVSFVENRQTNTRLLALLLWACVLMLCSVVYWFMAKAASAPTSPASG